MRSATFPIRVAPMVRAEVEVVVREGESLTQFIEEAVVAAAAWRRVQSEFVTRGEAAIERWKQEGGGQSVDEVMADLQARLDDAKRDELCRPHRAVVGGEYLLELFGCEGRQHQYTVLHSVPTA